MIKVLVVYTFEPIQLLKQYCRRRHLSDHRYGSVPLTIPQG